MDTAIDPGEFFRQHDINESLLLDLVIDDTVKMVINYAGATFDAMNPPGDSTTLRNEASLPDTVFMMICFNKVSNRTPLLDKKNRPFEIGIPLGKHWQPGPAVIYAARNECKGDGYYFECFSNKFEMLSFNFKSIRYARRIGRPSKTDDGYKYIDIVTGEEIDPRRPFEGLQ